MADQIVARRSNPNSTVILVCGLTGFAIGLWLWIGPSFRFQKTMRAQQDNILVLSNDGSSTLKQRKEPSSETPDEPSAFVALRNGWTYLLHQQDIDAAHEMILNARIMDKARQTQLSEFADALLPREWIDVRDFPNSTYFRKVIQTEGSLDRMFAYWRKAYEVAMTLPPSPEKVSILGRLGVMARILDHMQSPPEALANGEVRAEPSDIQEVSGEEFSKPGTVPAQIKSPARKNPKPLLSKRIDLSAETRKVRAETIATIDVLSQKKRFDLSFAGNFLWNLLRTAFFAISGSIIGAIGVVFNKQVVTMVTVPLIHVVQQITAYFGLDQGSGEPKASGESGGSEAPAEKPHDSA